MKKEVVERLLRLHDAINEALYYEDISFCMPALFSMFSYLWGKRSDDCRNHNKKRVPKEWKYFPRTRID